MCANHPRKLSLISFKLAGERGYNGRCERDIGSDGQWHYPVDDIIVFKTFNCRLPICQDNGKCLKATCRC